MFKKVISVFLAVILSLSVATVAFASSKTQNLPVIYLHGAGSSIYDANDKVIFPPDIQWKELVEKNLPAMSTAIITGLATDEWSDFGNLLVDIVDDVFADIKYGNDGEPTQGTRRPSDEQSVSVKNKSEYGLYDFSFNFDWRDDPMKISYDLDKYIDRVLEKTGETQVVIYAFSFGSCVLAAYLKQIGSEKINSVILHSPAVNGVVAAGSALAGNIKITADSVDNFVNNYQNNGNFLDDTLLGDMLSSLVTILNKASVLGLVSDDLDRFYKKFEEIINSRLGLATVATFPGIWAMVSDEYYEKAKETVFGDKGHDYDALIEKIDKYHYTVAVNSYSIFESFKNEGKNVSVIAKYGVSQLPLYKGCEYQADGVIATRDQSFGAVCADLEKTLSDKHIKAAAANGTDKYISGDCVIDASTCLFKDSTWFVRGIAHDSKRDYVDILIKQIYKKIAQPTVWDEDTPEQFNFINLDDKTLGSVTENDKPVAAVTKSWSSILSRFISSLVAFLIKLILKK